MIPTILIVIGLFFELGCAYALLSVGWSNFIRPALVLKYSIDDFIKYETREGRRFLKKNKELFFQRIIAFSLIGFVLITTGYYLGFATRGESFWAYRLFSEDMIDDEIWDRINEDGKYIADDGKEYTYFIIIENNQIRLNDKVYPINESNTAESEIYKQFSKIPRGSSVILIDNYAASSTYQSVRDILDSIGIRFEEERI